MVNMKRIAKFLVLGSAFLVSTTFASNEKESRVSMIQQTPDCSDFDVILPGQESPAFRVLLPENLYWNESEELAGLHTVSGRWERTPAEVSGTFLCGSSFEVTVRIEPRESEISIEMKVKNLTQDTRRNLWANICASVNHLPGEPSWTNRDFIPESIPLDRDLQGRYWYGKATPRSLQAWTPGGWTPMHAFPGRPDPDAVKRYFFQPGESNDAYACAVDSADGEKLFYQAWDVPCQYWSPFPGNACTHLVPLVASSLEPGQTAEIKGAVGVYHGSREEFLRRIASWMPE